MDNISKVDLSSPWNTYVMKLEALFGKDEDVKIEFDEFAPRVTIYVDGTDKSEAISRLLPKKKSFGNVDLLISVIPSNSKLIDNKNMIETALSGNPILNYIKEVSGVFSNPISYFVFKKEVVQFFNDDLSDVNGNCTTLYQDIAKEILGDYEGVFYCTDNSTDNDDCDDEDDDDEY